MSKKEDIEKAVECSILNAATLKRRAEAERLALLPKVIPKKF